MNVYGYGECLPYADNRVTLDTNKKDNWGRPVITIDCEFKANEKAQHEHMKITGREMMEAAGFKNISITSNMSFPAMPTMKWELHVWAMIQKLLC
jgi:hypothetical protein